MKTFLSQPPSLTTAAEAKEVREAMAGQGVRRVRREKLKSRR